MWQMKKRGGIRVIQRPLLNIFKWLELLRIFWREIMKKQLLFVLSFVSILFMGCSSTGPRTTRAAENPGYYGTSSLIDPARAIVSPTPIITVVQNNYPEGSVCGGNQTAVVVLVDPNLSNLIRSGLNLFITDLCNDGYSVIERESNFGNPPEVRNYLANLYVNSNYSLEGAIFIGYIPLAYQWTKFEYTNPNIPTLEQEFISFQYYSDLDGGFSVSPNYKSPGNQTYSYDIHDGNLDWEIWTSILPYYKGNVTETVNALNRYFTKNHNYRTGEYKIPRAFLEIDELYSTATSLADQDQLISYLRDGTYSWTPFSNSPNARLYVNGPTLSVSQGYADLNAGMADFTVTDTHGSGQINIPWVENNPVNTVFFWGNGCSIANIDQADNFLTSIIYSPTSLVLIGKGTTNDSGGMGSNQNGFFGHNIAMALSKGENFGQAILNHVNVPLIWPWSDERESFFGLSIIIGDPTLKLRP